MLLTWLSHHERDPRTGKPHCQVFLPGAYQAIFAGNRYLTHSIFTHQLEELSHLPVERLEPGANVAKHGRLNLLHSVAAQICNSWIWQRSSSACRRLFTRPSRTRSCQSPLSTIRSISARGMRLLWPNCATRMPPGFDPPGVQTRFMSGCAHSQEFLPLSDHPAFRPFPKIKDGLQ